MEINDQKMRRRKFFTASSSSGEKLWYGTGRRRGPRGGGVGSVYEGIEVASLNNEREGNEKEWKGLPLGTCQLPPALTMNCVVATVTKTLPMCTKKCILIFREFFIRLKPSAGMSMMPVPKKGCVRSFAKPKLALFTGPRGTEFMPQAISSVEY